MLDYMTRQGQVSKENTAAQGLLVEHAKPQLVQLEEKLQPSIANMRNVSAVAPRHLSNTKLVLTALQSTLAFQQSQILKAGAQVSAKSVSFSCQWKP